MFLLVFDIFNIYGIIAWTHLTITFCKQFTNLDRLGERTQCLLLLLTLGTYFSLVVRLLEMNRCQKAFSRTVVWTISLLNTERSTMTKLLPSLS